MVMDENRLQAAYSCWSCATGLSARAPFCHGCGVVQPPQKLDHFARLNLPIKYELDIADIERQYFGLQRYFHPDRFSTKSAREKAFSLQHATDLNDAYRVLKNPLSRAEYFLALLGHPVAGKGGATISDPKLLMEAMDMREELAAAETASAIADISAHIAKDIQMVERDLTQAITHQSYDAAGTLCVRLRYLVKFQSDVRERQARLEA